MKAADFGCESCKSKEKTLTVHHVHYSRLKRAWEYEAKELMCLCEDCHETWERSILPTLKDLIRHASVGVILDVATQLQVVGALLPDGDRWEDSYRWLANAALKETYRQGHREGYRKAMGDQGKKELA